MCPQLYSGGHTFADNVCAGQTTTYRGFNTMGRWGYCFSAAFCDEELSWHTHTKSVHKVKSDHTLNSCPHWYIHRFACWTYICRLLVLLYALNEVQYVCRAVRRNWLLTSACRECSIKIKMTMCNQHICAYGASLWSFRQAPETCFFKSHSLIYTSAAFIYISI